MAYIFKYFLIDYVDKNRCLYFAHKIYIFEFNCKATKIYIVFDGRFISLKVQMLCTVAMTDFNKTFAFIQIIVNRLLVKSYV